MTFLLEVLIKVILWALGVLAIFVIVTASIKGLFDYFKYGKSIFKVSLNKDKNSYEKILYEGLKRIKWPKKVIKLPYLNADYVLIDSNGITLFKVFSKPGRFDASKDEKYLYFFEDGREQRIKNPMCLLEEDTKYIHKLININVKCYIALIDTAFINGVSQIRLKAIPYKLDKGNNMVNLDKIEKKVSISV